MDVEINDNFYIFVGIFTASIVCYGVYICCYKLQNRFVEFNMVNVQDNIVNNDNILPIIHQNPIPPPYKEVDDDDIIMLPPPYTI